MNGFLRLGMIILENYLHKCYLLLIQRRNPSKKSHKGSSIVACTAEYGLNDILTPNAATKYEFFTHKRLISLRRVKFRVPFRPHIE